MNANATEKRLPDNATYGDVVNAGLILPFRKKYTFRDFRKLVEEGWSQIDARFIVLCSWAYYHGKAEYEQEDISVKLLSGKFLLNCELGTALL